MHEKTDDMDKDVMKKRLHLRIEQADEKMLTLLAEMTENLFEAYLPKALEQTQTYEIKAKTDDLRPRSREEMTKEIKTAMEDFEKGKTITLEKSNKEADSW